MKSYKEEQADIRNDLDNAYEKQAEQIAQYYKKMREQIKQDNVNHPEHYAGKVECIDAIESAVEGLEGLEAVCTANVIKYVYRWKKKNGVEDLRKASWYLNKLLDVASNKV